MQYITFRCKQTATRLFIPHLFPLNTFYTSYTLTLPKNRWKYIREAEADTKHGNRMFEKLKEEYWEYMENTKVGDPSNRSADLEYGFQEGLE